MKTRHRLLRGLTLSAAAASLLVALGAVGLIRVAVRERFVERLRAETAMLGEWTADLAGRDPQQLALRASRRLGVRVTLIDGDGTVLGDSSRERASLALMDNHVGRPEIRAAAAGRIGESTRLSETTNVNYFYSARLLEGADRIRFVRVALPLGHLQRVQRRYAWLVAAMALIAMALLTGLGYLAVRRLSRPIERLAEALEHPGELGPDLPEGGAGEEVLRLVGALRTSRQSLLDKVAEREAERALLSSVISGMNEGLLLVGADRRVRLSNEALRRALDVDLEPTGRPVEEVVRHPTILRDIETALDEGREVRGSLVQLAPTGRSFQLQATPLRDAPGERVGAALVLLFDVTRLERLEGVRREFVANVSHELRTPLSSIKAFVETLLEGGIDDGANATRFLQIIQKNADRMSDLIEDLTDLSLIETGAIQLELREIDAAETVREVVEHFDPIAKNRGVLLRADLPRSLPIRADRRRLLQVLTNLVDNAVKFTGRGGEVRIRGSLNRQSGSIRVEDTGVGIPAECLEKVFNRFHQVDRDRSLDTAGTGLGLAIVKHLMRLHEGRVRVESELGRGSTFTVEFPVGP